MRCPKCASTLDKVIDSRISKDGSTIRRRRECMDCNHRYSTAEQILRENLYVTKRDGRRENFDKVKIVNSLRRACQKRPVDAEQINILVEDMIDHLENEFGMEIPSTAIGEKVLENLKNIDPIAYIRFASVYKDFRNLEEFLDEIGALSKQPIL
ncbi:MAG: transcriptional repressor NrdR [Opitutales bacterium]|nr:transcriptional repressor NrdR [Opitutales bacterium]MDG2253599.1 transcriptional regulator NrdR [Opitutaceae bacterium]MBT5169315.1 transcriptional repressor NrdR [Opitutales bacterium]MBT5815639.1 transcriptional repressor NrdR [Opitutales bacterium]MBT6378626.1 transcriptional repressor NrdR [Opitutales bacterium]